MGKEKKKKEKQEGMIKTINISYCIHAYYISK